MRELLLIKKWFRIGFLHIVLNVLSLDIICETKIVKAKPLLRVTYKWVPKPTGDKEVTASTTYNVVNDITSEPVLVVDPIIPSEPSLVVDLSRKVTPVATPIVTPSNTPAYKTARRRGGDWKVVTRKSRNKGKRVAYQTARVVTYNLHGGHGSRLPRGTKGPNPYLS